MTCSVMRMMSGGLLALWLTACGSGSDTATGPAPVLTAVAPASGSTAGGSLVTLTGSNLEAATSVTFGGVAGTSLTVVSATEVSVKTPAHAAGAVDVRITTPGGSATLAGAYTYATPGIISTVAGTGTAGYAGDGDGGAAAMVDSPSGLAVDAAGNLLIADTYNHAIRLVTKNAGTFYGAAREADTIYTVVGTGSAGYSGDGGPAAAATLRDPLDIAVDSHGNLVIADTGNGVVRVVAASDGSYYGTAMTAGNIYTVLSMDNPTAVTLDAAGNLLVTEDTLNSVYLYATVSGTFYGQAMTAGNQYRVAGTGLGGFGYSGDGGAAVDAAMWSPYGIAVDAAGNLLIADNNNYAVRAVAHQSGTFYGIAMTAGNIYTVAGTGVALGSEPLGDGGPALSGSVQGPYDVAVDAAGNLVIATSNRRVRVVAASAGTYYGVAMTAGNIYTVAGDDSTTYTGDGILATAAGLAAPTSVALDADGKLFVSDADNHRVVRITP